MRRPHVPQSARVSWQRLVPQLSRVPFYPSLLLFVFLANIAVVFTVAPQSSVRTIVVGVALAGLLTAAMSALLRDRHRGAIVALAIIIIPISSLAPLLLAALGVAVALAVIAYSSTRGAIPWPSVTAAANVLSIGLLIMLMFKGISSGAASQMALDIGLFREPAPPRPGAAAWYPDIYILLLDGYPRADTLATDLEHDPMPFIAGLRDRGFIVAPRSHSSYGYTAGTLASMFQMRHLDDIPELQDVLAGRAPGRQIMRNVIGAGSAFRELRARGYDIITVTSGFDDVTIRSSDHVVDSAAVNEYEVTVLRSLGLPAIIDSVAPALLPSSVAKRVEDNLGSLGEVAAEAQQVSSGPRFVFVHVPSPHAPLLYEADGSIAQATVDGLYHYDVERAGLAELVRRYGANHDQLDLRVLQALDALDAVPAGRSRVVIVMSDHGTEVFSPDPVAGRRAHVANLFASRMPDGQDDPFGPAPATVDLFPVLLNQLFEAGIPIPEDRVRVSTADAPWNWTEIPPDP